MFNVLILMELSMLVGGTIALRAGVSGLAILLAIQLIPIAFWGGRPGWVFSGVGLLILIVMFIRKVKSEQVSGLYRRHDKRSQSTDQSSLSDIGQALSRGLHERYPDQYPPVEKQS